MWGGSPGPWGKPLVLSERFLREHKLKVLGRSVIFAPEKLSFFGERYPVFFAFIREIELTCSEGRLLIDLSAVREVKASALLVFFSCIEVAQARMKDPELLKLTYPGTLAVAHAFSKFGFWKLVGQSEFMPTTKEVGTLEVCTASRVATLAGDDSQLRKVVEYAQDMVLHGSSNEEADLLAYNAITESVSNVWQHAYDDDFFDGGVDPALAHWWIIVERIEDQFYIAVYDRGAGIPFTLQKKSWYHVAFVDAQGKVVGEIPVDAVRIKLAVEYGGSRFKEDTRGKGLSEAKDFVQMNPEGTMIIYSGFGSYTYYSSSGEDKLRKLPSSFGGTLIQWNLRLERK